MVANATIPGRRFDHMLTNTHPADVVAAIRKKGSSMSAIARQRKLHASALGHSLRRCIPAANRAIAKFLGLKVGDLWPEWFDENGRQRPGRGIASSKQQPAKSQKHRPPADKRRAA